MSILVNEKKQTKEPYLRVEPSSINEENQLLKNSVSYLKAELNKFKELPLLVCEIRRVFKGKAVIRIPNGSYFYVNVSGNLDLSIGDSVLVEQRSLTIVQKLDKLGNFDIEDFIIVERPNTPWQSLGGLNKQIQELKEVIELPLLKPELFEKIGIDPPNGVLLYGPPGTGKTMLAKAVATSTNSTFIEIVASELVQKFIGEGAKLVKDIFRIAREKAPSIIFIDEIDALAADRLDIGTGGEREVQRTFMQLLTEMDGFKSLDNVKVIAATNRIDIIDEAILRPGRFDRLIEISLPDKESRKNILSIHSKSMSLDNIDFSHVAEQTEGMSGADLKAVCTEAGYFALRENRFQISSDDFIKAVSKVSQTDQEDNSFESMFG